MSNTVALRCKTQQEGIKHNGWMSCPAFFSYYLDLIYFYYLDLALFKLLVIYINNIMSTSFEFVLGTSSVYI